ncbi:MAG: ABC transporter permease [Gammaproteobacteria bacterium]
MLFGEMLAVALQSIRANLFRGFLTMLGIIIGVASVITMVALGSGAQHAIDEQIDALGASVLTIRSSGRWRSGVGQSGATLTIDDANALAADARLLGTVVPEAAQMLQVKTSAMNQNLRIVGTTPDFARVHNYRLDLGDMLTNADEAARRRVAVIGYGVPAKFETTADAMLGEEIHIGGTSFEVIGVFAEKGSSGWRNVDAQIWVPLSTAQVRLFGTKSLEVIAAQVSRGVPVETAIVDVERIMRREHKILPGARNDFSIGDPAQFFNVRQAATQVFAILLASIASISLIVGGIGIMNIMLVTVTERTREIGVRKALGATRMNILMQFLIEAMVLCMLGGTVGVLLGVGISTLMTEVIGWQMLVSPAAIVIAFGFSAGIGLFFGIWPARKAARLDPIECLRYE